MSAFDPGRTLPLLGMRGRPMWHVSWDASSSGAPDWKLRDEPSLPCTLGDGATWKVIVRTCGTWPPDFPHTLDAVAGRCLKAPAGHDVEEMDEREYVMSDLTMMH